MQSNQDIGFWNKLDQDIDNIGNRAKNNLKKYQMKQYQTLKVKTTRMQKPRWNPECSKDDYFKDVPNKSRTGRKQITQMQREEKNRQKIIKNRLVYLQNDRKKQNKTIQIAKKKFQNLITIRNASFREKQALRKRKSSFIHESKSEIQSRVKLVHTARQHKQKSITNWRKGIQLTASNIRFESASNQSLIERQKQKKQLDNIQKANKTKADLERSRSIISQITQKKRQSGQLGYLHSINEKHKKLYIQKKHNEHLQKKLRKETEKIAAWKEKASRQINEYRSILNVRKNRSSIPTERSLQQTKSTKSFYLTIY